MSSVPPLQWQRAEVAAEAEAEAGEVEAGELAAVPELAPALEREM